MDGAVEWMLRGEVNTQVTALVFTSLATLFYRWISVQPRSESFWVPKSLNMGEDYLVTAAVLVPLLWIALIAPTLKAHDVALASLDPEVNLSELKEAYSAPGVPLQVVKDLDDKNGGELSASAEDVEDELQSYRFNVTLRAGGMIAILMVLFVFRANLEGKYFVSYREGVSPTTKQPYADPRRRRFAEWGGGVVAPLTIGILGFLFAVSGVTP